MALSGEDKADVSRAFGKKAAKAVSHATNDAKNKAIHAKSGVRKSGRTDGISTPYRNDYKLFGRGPER